jgi:DNA processing protein
MDNDRERLALLALCAIKGVRWDLLAREAQRPGGVARLLTGELTETSEHAEDTSERLASASGSLERRMEHAAEAVAAAALVGARLITVLDDDYPTNLRLVYNLPPFLFVRGELRTEDTRAVAVVGTRNASPEGLELATAMAEGLSRSGVTIVSGLARGIDTAAHRATLDAAGRTIAVIGTGVLHTYPTENAELVEEVAQHGAVVSQFWPATRPASYNFPRRNVVTSGISQGTVVVEATRTSGAKMQARLALEHGKTVFLVRSLVTREEWARQYLERRARTVEVDDVSDVLARLRSPDQVGSLTDQRRQLAFDLA